MEMGRPIVGIVGVTHLGINTGTAIADRGFSTVWYSDDCEAISLIEKGELPVFEPDLDSSFKKNRPNIELTNSLSDLERCDVVYIAIDVPTSDTGFSNLAVIEETITRALRYIGESSTLVILSQVPPGFTRKIHFPHDRLFYQVETLVFGQALQRAINPERFIVGLSDADAALPVSYRTLLERFGCSVLKMRYESAELAKISINCCLAAMVSTANVLAELCEQIGADWAEIVPALRLDKRIGPHSYIMAGLGLAGGNLERDLATVTRLAKRVGSDSVVVKSWIKNSDHRKGWVYRNLEKDLYANDPVAVLGVLGLAYKKDTHSVKNSPSLSLLERLKNNKVRVYDPVIKEIDYPFVHYVNKPLDVCIDADAVAIMTPWDEFSSLDLKTIASMMRGRLLLDPYGVFSAKDAWAAGFDYRTLGLDSSIRVDG